jgi:Domain of unknown function (DUF6901)
MCGRKMDEMMHIRYHFKMKNGEEEIIDVSLHEKTLNLMNDIPENPASWTKINFHQCPHCLLDIRKYIYCPIAVHLMKMIELLKNFLSYEEIYVDVTTPQRSIYRTTSAQKGLSSLMGLIMATSGCPHMEFFKPMARFHLPMASIEETIYRAASMYLLAQYFLHKEGKKADMELEGLKKIYQDIKIINESMAERIRNISDKDVALNSLVILDIFAQTLPFAIEESLEEFRHLFSSYFKGTENEEM